MSIRSVLRALCARAGLTRVSVAHPSVRLAARTVAEALEKRVMLSVSPTVNGPTSVQEGDAYTLSLNSGRNADAWTIDWGDGTGAEYLSGDPTTATHTFAAGASGWRAIQAAAIDADGTVPADPFSVEYTNLAPALSLSVSQPSFGLADGQGLTVQFDLVASVGTTAADPTFSSTLDWGDGSPTVSFVSSNSFSHTYYGTAPHTLSATVYDNHGGSDSTELTLDPDAPATSTTIAPVLYVYDPAPEGSEYDVQVFASGPASLYIHGWHMDWGDGTTTDQNWGYPVLMSHTFADDGTYPLSISDDSGAYTATLGAAMSNVDPVVTLTGATSVDEGAPYTLGLSSFDPGTDTIDAVTVDWGDGHTQTVLDLTGLPATLTHTFDAAASPGPYTVTASATDEDGGPYASDPMNPLTVSLTPTAPTGLAASAYSDSRIDLSWADASAAATGYEVQRSPDGDPDGDTWTTLSVVNDPNDSAYTDAGLAADTRWYYRVRALTGSKASAWSDPSDDVTFTTPAPSATGPATADEGDDYTVDLSAGGSDGVDHWSINWGDGQTDTVDSSQATHAYADDGSYTVLAVATAYWGTTYLAASQAVTINNVAPELQVSGPADGVEGTPVTFDAYASDPAGDADPLVYNWSVTKGGSPYALPAGTVTDGPSFTFTPTDNDAYTVTASVDDGDGGTATSSQDLAVANLRRDVTVGSLAQAAQGQDVTVPVSVQADPNGEPLTSLSIDWGDGSGAQRWRWTPPRPPSPAGTAAGSAATRSPSPPPTPTPPAPVGAGRTPAAGTSPSATPRTSRATTSLAGRA